MKKLWRRLVCFGLGAILLLGMTGCKTQKTVEEATYPGQDDMTFEELLEMDRQNPITIRIMVADLTEPATSGSPTLQVRAEGTGTPRPKAKRS